jgi:5-methylcytosine-specific restriction endonuclease McrA
MRRSDHSLGDIVTRKRTRSRLPKVVGPRTLSQRNGGTREWGKLSKQVAREEPICWLQLPGCTGRSTGADHYYPVKTHPHLKDVRENLRGACLHCNTARGATPVHQLDKLRATMAAKRQPPRALGFFG